MQYHRCYRRVQRFSNYRFLFWYIHSYFYLTGNQYWFGLRKPPCQFLFGICPCLQLFGNISYSLYSNNNSNNSNGSTAPSGGAPGAAGTPTNSSTSSSSNSQDLSEITLVYINSTSSESSKKKAKKLDHVVVPALALEMPD